MCMSLEMFIVLIAFIVILIFGYIKICVLNFKSLNNFDDLFLKYTKLQCKYEILRNKIKSERKVTIYKDEKREEEE